MHSQERRPILLLCMVLLAAVVLSAAQNQDKTASSERNTVEGAKIFRRHCAACHGNDGRGHRPASVALKHPVPDLTLISQRSGGKFPYQRVKGIIEGNEQGLLAHGDREMPIWGPIFHEVESDQDWGEVRLDAITKHMASIQQKWVACDLDRGKQVLTAVRLLTKFVTLMSGIPQWEQPEKFNQVVVDFHSQNYLRWYSG